MDQRGGIKQPTNLNQNECVKSIEIEREKENGQDLAIEIEMEGTYTVIHFGFVLFFSAFLIKWNHFGVIFFFFFEEILV